MSKLLTDREKEKKCFRTKNGLVEMPEKHTTRLYLCIGGVNPNPQIKIMFWKLYKTNIVCSN